MLASVRSLLEHAIDYAGLFPPAALTMEAATREYADLLAGQDEWIVRRFVCPVAWLPELLESLLKHVPADTDEPWLISVLGTSLDGYRQDLNAVERFEEQAGGRALVECYEVKANRAELSRNALRHLTDAGFEEVYVELPWSDELIEGLHQLAEVDGVGAKARTGGLEPKAFPSNEQLAQFIHECVSLDIPFKLTAGLHHPAPQQDESIPARMHGFLNVLVACALAFENDLARTDIVKILAEDDTSVFRFSERAVNYGDLVANEEALEDARSAFVSWGSCSIREPLGDLIHLGLAQK